MNDLHAGDCIEVMATFEASSVDAVVTDPPYGISFMGKHWDRFDIERRVGERDQLGAHHWTTKGTGRQKPRSESAFANDGSAAGSYDFSSSGTRAFQAWVEIWASECLRLLKPGGHLLSFGGTRTYHRLAAGVEDAGFEIRDQLAWLFGSGFPKSRNLGDGYGTALKPAHEPIVLARKPLVGTVATNVSLHGVGGLNIDGCRIAIEDRTAYEANHSDDRGHAGTRDAVDRGATDLRPGGGSASDARWPANVILDETAAAMLDEQSGELVSGANPTARGTDKDRGVYGDFAGQTDVEPARGADVGGASRFFYCAKTSRAERNAGLERFEKVPLNWSNGDQNPGTFQSDGTDRSARNHHPTVKPIALMRWLARLVTPPGGLILDPFLGSGTTGIAAVLEGFRFVGVEREPDYLSIAQARIRFWETHGEDALRVAYAIDEREAITASGQTSLLDEDAA